MDKITKKGKILVVDDTPFTINILKETLEQEGYQVFIATSGEKALKRAEQTVPDLIILDVLMPDIDGFETCRKLKKINEIKDIPILFMTGLTSIENKVKGFEAGGVDYLIKPIEIEEVLSRIKTHISMRFMQLELKEKNDQLESEINIRRIAEEEIRGFNSELEQRVEERTAELANANRMLKILSECNQVLVRASNEQDLLNQICDIIVEFGGYPLIQVGFLEAGKIKIAAQDSFNTDLLEVLNSSIDELSNILDTAIKRVGTGKPYLVSNIFINPHFTFWNTTGIFFDYMSFIALPLSINNYLFGVLGIYTSRPDAFNSEEEKLLLELASDISYGIKSLREQEEKRKAEEALIFNESRLSALLQLNEMRDAESSQLYDFVLNQAVLLTKSLTGYLAFIGDTSENELVFYLPKEKLSDAGNKKSKNSESFFESAIYKLANEKRQAIIINNFQESPLAIEFPGQNESIKNHLLVPLFDKDKLTFVVGVSNKNDNYDDTDIRQIELLITGLWRLTQKRKSDEALRISEERWHRLVEYNPACIVIYSEDKIAYANAAWLILIGAGSESEVLNKPLYYFTNEDYKTVAQSKIHELTRMGLPSVSFEEKFTRITGEEIFAEVTAIPLNFFGRKAVMKVCWDITERKNLVNQLITAKERAERADELKSEFLAQISHEIRTPLNVVLSFSKLIQSEIDAHLTPDLVESFSSIEMAGKRIIRTVDLILNMAELQTGTFEPIRKNFDIKEEILEILKHEYHLSAELKNLQFQFTYLTNDTEITADVYSIEQIFTNLIDNAIKFTPSGKVELIVERDTSGNLRVSVEDTGIGISENYLPRLFEPFSQEEQGYRRRFEGNGLGLALVKRYCAVNNAEISVESCKGKGSVFTVVFQ